MAARKPTRAGAQASGLSVQKTIRFANDALELSRQGRQEEALQLLCKAAEREPRHAGIQFNLGLIRCLLRDYETGAANFQKALRLDDMNMARLVALGREQLSYGRYGFARTCFRAAAAHGGASAPLSCALGETELAAGEDGAAAGCFAEAVGLDPECAQGYYGLSRCGGLEAAPGQALRELAARKPADRYVHYALGWQVMREGDYARSFDYFREANRLSLEGLQVFPAQAASDLAGHAEIIRSLFGKEFFAARAQWGNSEVAPVFVVGMPFSGTACLSRKLAAHEAVLNCGLSPWFNQQIFRMLGECGHDFSKLVEGITAPQTLEMAARYLAVQLSGHKGRALLVDANPYNFINLWLIALLFPRARIINCRRDRAQNILACFCTDTPAQPFTADIAASARYYDEYDRLMTFWREVLPVQIHDYEWGAGISEVCALCKREPQAAAENIRPGAGEAELLAQAAPHYAGYVPQPVDVAFGINVGGGGGGALDLAGGGSGGFKLDFGNDNKTEKSPETNNPGNNGAQPFKLNF